METSEFLGKLKSKYLWLNIVAMAIVVVAACVAVMIALNSYTHHGEAIPIPDVRHKTFADAQHILTDAGLTLTPTLALPMLLPWKWVTWTASTPLLRTVPIVLALTDMSLIMWRLPWW